MKHSYRVFCGIWGIEIACTQKRKSCSSSQSEVSCSCRQEEECGFLHADRGGRLCALRLCGVCGGEIRGHPGGAQDPGAQEVLLHRLQLLLLLLLRRPAGVHLRGSQAVSQQQTLNPPLQCAVNALIAWHVISTPLKNSPQMLQARPLLVAFFTCHLIYLPSMPLWQV